MQTSDRYRKGWHDFIYISVTHEPTQMDAIGAVRVPSGAIRLILRARIGAMMSPEERG